MISRLKIVVLLGFLSFRFHSFSSSSLIGRPLFLGRHRPLRMRCSSPPRCENKQLVDNRATAQTSSNQFSAGLAPALPSARLQPAVISPMREEEITVTNEDGQIFHGNPCRCPSPRQTGGSFAVLSSGP